MLEIIIGLSFAGVVYCVYGAFNKKFNRSYENYHALHKSAIEQITTKDGTIRYRNNATGQFVKKPTVML